MIGVPAPALLYNIPRAPVRTFFQPRSAAPPPPKNEHEAESRRGIRRGKVAVRGGGGIGGFLLGGEDWCYDSIMGPRKWKAGREGNEQKRAPRNEVKVQEETEAETLYPQINKNTKQKNLTHPRQPLFPLERKEKRDKGKKKIKKEKALRYESSPELFNHPLTDPPDRAWCPQSLDNQVKTPFPYPMLSRPNHNRDCASLKPNPHKLIFTISFR